MRQIEGHRAVAQIQIAERVEAGVLIIESRAPSASPDGEGPLGKRRPEAVAASRVGAGLFVEGKRESAAGGPQREVGELALEAIAKGLDGRIVATSACDPV